MSTRFITETGKTKPSETYFEIASGRNDPMGLSWIAFIAGSMSNARMKPEFALTISFSCSFDFFPGNLGEAGIELVCF